MKSQITNALSDFFFEYETPRQVLVRNRRVGVVCRLIQLGVLAYIIGWVFIYEKGYQSTDTAISSVFSKMKGVGYTNVNGTERVWDVADYVFPAQVGDSSAEACHMTPNCMIISANNMERTLWYNAPRFDIGDSSFVVMTNYIITEGQKMGKCPELPDKHNCTSDANCEGGSFKRTGHGQMTGVCVSRTKTCEVLAWCPVENDDNIPESNLVEGIDATYISKCLYDQKNAPLCPIFKLGDIVKLSGFNFEMIAREGGAIGIVVDWTCNFDIDVRHCKPTYNFHGLYGNPHETDKARASVGYNFRYAKYYLENGVQMRTLLKVFGIRIDIIVQSLARKFDIIPTLTAIGSGVGIFGVATVVCDLVLLHLLPKREFYKNMKFKYTDTHTQHDSESLGLDTSIYYTLEANARQVQDTDQSNVSAYRSRDSRVDFVFKDPDSEAGSTETGVSR
ncbi:hypothetical protein L3Q82_022051, partial [Scortum barcoo]